MWPKLTCSPVPLSTNDTIRSIQKRTAPESKLYLAAPGYYESSVGLGLNWAHTSYKPGLWFADERFQRNGSADLFDQVIVPTEKVTGGISESALQFRSDISRGIPAESFSPVRKGPEPKHRPPRG